jgi:DNA-binding transcriptional LysR family regulator
MFDKHIETFLKVAKLGSFSKAGRALYISPSAILQQISLLESNLGVELFTRTSRGVKLTPAGEYFQREAGSMVMRAQEIRKTLAQFSAQQSKMLKIGINKFHALRHFYEVWFRFHHDHPDYQTEIITMEEASPSELTNIDLVEGMLLKEKWHKDFTFYPQGDTPLCLALPKWHPLAQRHFLTIDDLSDISVVSVRCGISAETDKAVLYLQSRNIKIITVDLYDHSTTMLCSTNGYSLLLARYWQDMMPQLVTLPVAWDYHVPFGFFIRKQTSASLKILLNYISQQS